MPFQSQAQMKYMFANMPAMAKRWAQETPNIKSLPRKKKKGNKYTKALGG